MLIKSVQHTVQLNNQFNRIADEFNAYLFNSQIN